RRSTTTTGTRARTRTAAASARHVGPKVAPTAAARPALEPRTARFHAPAGGGAPDGAAPTVTGQLRTSAAEPRPAASPAAAEAGIHRRAKGAPIRWRGMERKVAGAPRMALAGFAPGGARGVPSHARLAGPSAREC